MKNSVTFSVFDKILPAELLSKAQRRKIEIIEATIRLCASEGVDCFTYEKLAKLAKASRRLVQIYFPDRDELILTAMKYIRGRFQNHAIQSFQGKHTPEQRLKAYVDSHFQWVKQNPDEVKVWLLFYYYCSFREKYLQVNTELVDQGFQRICGLLSAGRETRAFQVRDVPRAAKLIQITITGALIEMLTQKKRSEQTALKKTASDHCLAIAAGSVRI